MDRVETYLDNVKKWLPDNKLRLNPDKTELIIFGLKYVNKSFPVNTQFPGNFLSPAEAVRNPDVWFDSDFSFLRHVQNICKSCFAHIQDLKHFRGYLTSHVALMAVNAFVGSRLDYCNSLFRSLSAVDCRSLASIITNTTKYSRITPVRKTLCWLPMEHHSIFNIALLVYKFLHSGYPKYFVPFSKPRHSVYNT